MERAIASAFPHSSHQLCVVHFKRHALNATSVRHKEEI
nr:transposase [Porphyromonas cangingivalis]